MRSWWQKIKQHPFITVGIVVALLAIIVFMLSVHVFGWNWTGFTGGESKTTITSASKGITTATELQPRKTLWDWLGLLAILAIPVVVGIGAAWFTTQQAKVSDQATTDNQREAALQAYIDKMSELVKANRLGESAGDEQIRQIARARTLTVLRRLDAERKGSVLQFLYEFGLIDRNKPIVDLSKADLRGVNLWGADLSGANLRGADLRGVNLREIIMHQADLRGADLRRADLRGAYLGDANLDGAYLQFAHLQGADLREADLSGASLSAANLRGADLRKLAIREYIWSVPGLQRADLPEADLSGAKLEGADLRKADLGEADLEGADLRWADLRKADLSGAKLRAAKLLSTDLRHASLNVADLMRGAGLQNAIMPDGTKHR